MRRSVVTLMIAGLASVAALASQTGTAATPWAIHDAPEELRPMIARADVMIGAMNDSLLRQLHDALAEGGPVLAIGVCHVDPADLARRIGRALGIQAGFTSDRLRNTVNTPRPWASKLVADSAGLRGRDVDGFAVDLGDKVGVLRPIVQQPVCATCHGPIERISPAVRAVLAQRYPADSAVGFAEGDIRGWYWVEIPKPRR